MTHRERILTVLSRKPADRVPLDLAGFNREAYRLFIERTGSMPTGAIIVGKVKKMLRYTM